MSAMNVKNVQQNANTSLLVVNGTVRLTKQRSMKQHVLIRRVNKYKLYLPISTSLRLLFQMLLESGSDVMAALKDREAKNNEEKKLFSCLVDLLSYEKITFNGELMFLFYPIQQNFKSFETSKKINFLPHQKNHSLLNRLRINSDFHIVAIKL